MEKVLAAVTAGVLCVGSVGVTDLQGVLESAGTMLTASAEEGTYGNLSYGVTNAGEIEITGAIWVLLPLKFRLRLTENL